MSHAPFTEAEVNYLLKARKFIHGLIRDTTENPDAPILEIVYRVRRVDRPNDDIKLRLSARRPKPVMATMPRLRPSAALLWHSERIRGIDRKIVHPVIKDGMIVKRVREQIGVRPAILAILNRCSSSSTTYQSQKFLPNINAQCAEFTAHGNAFGRSEVRNPKSQKSQA